MNKIKRIGKKVAGGRKEYVRESVARGTIGVYAHEYGDGSAKVKAYVAANEELQLDRAVRTTQIDRVDVEVHVKESKDLGDDGSFYEKRVGLRQVRAFGEPVQGSTVANVGPAAPAAQAPVLDGTPRAGMDNVSILKNFLDKAFDQIRDVRWIAIAAIVIAVVALLVRFA